MYLGTSAFTFQIHISVPPGTTANIILPIAIKNLISLRSKSFSKDEGKRDYLTNALQVMRNSRISTQLDVDAGKYDFKGTLECAHRD